MQTLRIGFDDCSSPAAATWTDVSAAGLSGAVDPVLSTSCRDGRTVVAGVQADTTGVAVVSRDDGASWTTARGNIGNVASGDVANGTHGTNHQTVGAGGGVSPVASTVSYYCPRDNGTTLSCLRSTDGGVSYGPAVQVLAMSACGGVHGRIRVALDGTAYLGDSGCGTHQAVAVSTDHGLQWALHPILTSMPGNTAPSVAVGAHGTVFVAYQNADNRVHVAVSTNHGLSWHDDHDVGVALGLLNEVLPAATAGDDNRVAVAFLGTTMGGDYQDTATFHGDWRLYIASTFDGGQHWVAVDATPDAPIQHGAICTGSVACTSASDNRSAIDAIDIAVDREGRVIAGYTDGCGGRCSSGKTATATALGMIARQSGGHRLFARYDTSEPVAPAAPAVQAAQDASIGTVYLSWSTPDGGGAPITGYRIYRDLTPTPAAILDTERPLAITGLRTTYVDMTARPGVIYYYRVVAVNTAGVGLPCRPVVPVILQTGCLSGSSLGHLIVTSPTGNQLGSPGNRDLDIQAVYVGQPRVPVGTLAFSMRVADLSTMLLNRQWRIAWGTSGGARYYAGMNTDATGQVSFDYGQIIGTTTSGSVVGTPLSSGAADPSSHYDAVGPHRGVITIVLPATAVGNPGPGTVLQNIEGDTYAGGSDVSAAGSTTDSTAQGNVTLVSCADVPAARGPAGAPSGPPVPPVPSSVTPHAAVTATATATATTGEATAGAGMQFYFAGGEDTPREQALLNLLDTGVQPVHLGLTFYFPDGTTRRATLDVVAGAHLTTPLGPLMGHRGPFGLALTSNRRIAAQLTLVRPGRDDDSLVGAPRLAQRWYFTEGYTGLSFHEALSILNPDSAQPAVVRLHLLQKAGQPQRTVFVAVAAHSVRVVDVNALLPGLGVSVIADADHPVVVERTLTFGHNGYGLTTHLGSTVAASGWRFAEGSTVNHLETYITVLNTRTIPAPVQAHFYGGNGQLLASRTFVVPGGSRTSLNLSAIVPHTTGIASLVTSNLPIVVERSEYFGSPNAGRVPGSDGFGQIRPSREWTFAGGDTTGQSEFLLLLNTGGQPDPVRVQLYESDGNTAFKDVTIAPHARYTMEIGRTFPALPSVHGLTVTSLRAMGFVAEETVFTPDRSTLRSVEGQPQ